MRVFIFFLISFLFVGRVIPPSIIIDVYFEKHLTQQFKYQAQVAMNEWESATQNEVLFIVKPDISINDYQAINDYNSLLIRFGSYEIERKRIDDIKPSTLAVFSFINNEIVLLEDHLRTYDDPSQIMLHELGHRLGLAHSPIKNTVMYPIITYGSTFITSIDINEFCMVNDCSWK